MVAAGEASVAMPTFERLRAGVLAVMARQFVRTRKSPFAALPAALVRLLPCNRREESHVSESARTLNPPSGRRTVSTSHYKILIGVKCVLNVHDKVAVNRHAFQSNL